MTVVPDLRIGATKQEPEEPAVGAPGGLKVLWQGPAYSSFNRPLPQVVESTLFNEFEEYFNQTQVCRFDMPICSW